MSDIIPIKVPPLGESIVEATVAKWYKKIGDTVTVDEIILDLETEKVTMEIFAPSSGVLKEIIAPSGNVVNIGQTLGSIALSDQASSPTNGINQNSATINVENANKKPEDLKQEAAISTNGHAIGQSDKPQEKSAEQEQNFVKQPVSNNLDKVATDQRSEQRIPMSAIRKKIAQQLKFAQNNAAILTTFNEADMSAIINLRNQYKDLFVKKYNVKLGFMSFFVKACVYAIKKVPIINSFIEQDEIVIKNYYDFGVAMAAPQGLVVPVIRNVDLLAINEIEASIAELTQKAKDTKLTIADMSGGTFTISNGGTFGSLLSTPILNPPQSAILGMHKIQDRPIAENGCVVIKPMMYLALSYDHRLIDGQQAVTFLVQVKNFLENPAVALLDV